MRGTIRKKGNMYYIRYYVDGKQVEKKGGSTQEEAERALTSVMYRIQNGYVNPSEMTIKEYLSMWIEDYVKDDKSKGTYNRYVQICDLHINPCLGNIRLCDLKVINIEKYVKELKKKKVTNKPLSPTTVQSCYGVLKAALNKAIKLQLISDNPCRFVDTPKRSKFKANVLTVEEFSKIYNSLDPKKYEDYIMQFAMSLTLETGLRRGEMCGLTWKDINFEEKYLEVNQALIRDKNKYIISDLKTESSYRKLPLSDDIINKLNIHKTKQKKNRVKYGGNYTKVNIFEKVEYNLIFTWENGKYIIPSNFLQRFKRLCKYNGIDKNIRWHDLRHTNATLLLEGGANIKTVQERLGHSLMQTTSDTYAHVTEKMNREATNIITDILKIK